MAVQSQVDILLRAVGAGQVSAALSSIQRAVGGVVRSFVPFATLGGAVATIPLLIRNASAAADQFKNLAERIGGTIEGVQVLDYLARKSGQGADVFTKGIDHLRVALAGARTGSEEAYAPFRRLNLTVAEFDGLPAERQLELIAKAMVNAKDPSDAFLAVTQLLGVKAVPELRVALEKLATGYDSVAASAKAAGQIMSDKRVKQLADENAKIERAGRFMTVVGGEIAGGILDTVDAFKGLDNASDNVSKMERAFGKTSREAALARLRLVEFLVEAGKFKDAQSELSKTEGKIPANFLAKARGLSAQIEAALPKPPTSEQAAAAKLSEEARAHVVAEEQANFWLTANAKKITDAVEANRQALLTDAERLTLTQLRVAGIDAETAAAVKAAGSDAERRKAELLHAEERSKLLRDIADIEHRITAEKDDQARKAQADKVAAIHAQEIAAQEQLDKIANDRRDIERSTILDLGTKRVRLEENTKAYRDQLAALIASKEAELAITADVEQQANLKREIARLQHEGTQFGAATAEPTKLEASRTALADLSNPAAHLQKGQGLEAGANNFLTQLGTDADFAASRVQGTLNDALQGTSDLLYGLATGSISFRDAWGQATAWVGQQFLKMTTEMIARMIYRNTVERALVALGVTTHVAGESTKTAATVAGGNLRIATIIKEALASVYHAAIEAYKAVVGIPYVGPFIAAGALAAALALGLNLVGKIGHADGAIIRGPGGPRDDRIPAMLSNGEAVTRAAVVTKFGEDFFKKLNNGVLDLSAIRSGVARADGGFAAAGSVQVPDIFVRSQTPTLLRQPDGVAASPSSALRDLGGAQQTEPRARNAYAYFDRAGLKRALQRDQDAEVIDIIDRNRHRWNI